MKSLRLVSFVVLAAVMPVLPLSAAEGPPAVKPPEAAPLPPLAAGPAAPAAAQGGLHLGYLDLAKVNAESEAGKAVIKQLEERKKRLQGQIDSRRKQIEKQQAALESKLKGLPPNQREAKVKEFQKKVEEYQKFGQGSEAELMKLQQDLLADLYGRIEKACSAYGRNNRLALIVVKRELLYLDSGVETVDVTDGVIKLLDGK